MKNYFIYTLISIVFFSSVNIVSGSLCIRPFPGIAINENTIFCDGVYDMTLKKGIFARGFDGSIVINKSNIELDCNNASLIGEDFDYGILIKSKNNVTIKNCYLFNFKDAIHIENSANIKIINNHLLGLKEFGYCGICLENSGFNQIINNTIMNKGFAIYTYFSNSNQIINNTINRCNTGIDLASSKYNKVYKNSLKACLWSISIGGYDINTFNNSIGLDNTVDNSTFYYIFSKKDLIFENIKAHTFVVAYSKNITLKNSIIENGNGVQTKYSNKINIINNTIKNNKEEGVYITNSNYSLIHNNQIFDNFGRGIELSCSQRNNITKNIIENNYEEGIFLHPSSINNVILSNDIKFNVFEGIEDYSKKNIIRDNTLKGNMNLKKIVKAYINELYKRITKKGIIIWIGFSIILLLIILIIVWKKKHHTPK